jgi:hypothetical protein
MAIPETSPELPRKSELKPVQATQDSEFRFDPDSNLVLIYGSGNPNPELRDYQNEEQINIPHAITAMLETINIPQDRNIFEEVDKISLYTAIKFKGSPRQESTELTKIAQLTTASKQEGIVVNRQNLSNKKNRKTHHLAGITSVAHHKIIKTKMLVAPDGSVYANKRINNSTLVRYLTDCLGQEITLAQSS